MITAEHCQKLKLIYKEIVHWRPKFFTLKKNKTGHAFIDTLHTTLSALLDRSQDALLVAMVMPHLVLPRTKSENDGSQNQTLTRRLEMWLNGQFDDLFHEAKALQLRLKRYQTKQRDVFKEFDHHVTTGKISNALRCLEEDQKGLVLSLSDKIDNKTVNQILREKHPEPADMKVNYLVENPFEQTLPFHPSIFDQLNARTIRNAAMKTQGSHGPSGLDANEWRRFLTLFGQSSVNLCKCLADIAKLIATTELPSGTLEAYNACRLIPLDKNPGVRPIGVGEVLRRIIGRSILKCLSNDLKQLGGNLQLCLGQKCGIEFAIHSLRDAFDKPESEGMLLIDATNAFNSLNRKLALENIKVVCPSLLIPLKNSYASPCSLFVNGKVIPSQEGTTQGDPLAMAMYGIALLPLVKLLENTDIVQKWYADDGNAVGKLEDLHRLHEALAEHGPAFGYHITKCHIIAKKNHIENAKEIFKNKDVDVLEGHRVLGSVIGSTSACHDFKTKIVSEHAKTISQLSQHAKTAPQNVYQAYTKGMQTKFSFLTRTTPDMEEYLQEPEKHIKENLIPSLTGKNTVTTTDRILFSLPVRNGGLNISLPEDNINNLRWSKSLGDCLSNADPMTAENSQHRIKRVIREEKKKMLTEKIDKVKQGATEDQLYALQLASEKGASSWLNALPLKRYGFTLTKTEFRDGLAIRYGWEPKNIPASCRCRETFNLAHALHCAKGGYTHMRHNEIRDTFANLMKDVCFDVELEPKLQPLEGESFDNKTTTTEDEARLDIKANGLWDTRFNRTFFDVKIFNPHAKSCPRNIKEAYKLHEAQKRLKYEQRIVEVENSSFNPLVFATTGGAAPTASKVMSRLAFKLSEKSEDTYAEVMGYIRTKVSFALLKSSVLCLRGCRSLKRQPEIIDSAIGAIVEEGRLSQ